MEPEVEMTSRDTQYSEGTPPGSPSTLDTVEVEYAPRAKKQKKEGNSSTEGASDLDAIGHLFKSYAQTFQGFSRRNQIALKVELAQLFADIEAKEMIENNQV